MSCSASGSIDVVTNDARFIDGCPSTRRPRWMRSKASRGSIPWSGKRSRGSGWANLLAGGRLLMSAPTRWGRSASPAG